MKRLLSVLTSLAVVLTGVAALVAVPAGPAAAYAYPQTAWHASSVWNDGSMATTSVIDCQSSIINLQSGGVAFDGDGNLDYTPPPIVGFQTGIASAMGSEVDLDGAHPRVGETFYLHLYARSVATPCGGQGVVPYFQLPTGVALDSASPVVCYFDAAEVTNSQCPQQGDANHFQSAFNSTGLANSYQILCIAGCLDTNYWAVNDGHYFEWGIPVKSTAAFNDYFAGGTVVHTQFGTYTEPLTGPINVFNASAGNGTVPPTSVGAGGQVVQDPGFAYRVRYDAPSTQARSTYTLDTSITTTYGLLSRGELFTNHVPGEVVFIRDTTQAKIASATTSVQSLSTNPGQVQQIVVGPIDGSGASFQSEFDWRNSGSGSSPGMGVVPGTTYYWRTGFIPEPPGTTLATAVVYWGEVQSFTGPSTSTCNGLAVTVDIGLGELPTDGDDVILGSPGDDAINAGKGNDTICAGGGNDTVIGGAGNDRIWGGDGADTLVGQIGNDSLYGEAGDDVLLPGAGVDTAFGGDGFDTISYSDLTTPYSSPGVINGISVDPGGCSSGYPTACLAAGLDVIAGGLGGPNDGQAPPERVIGSPFDDQLQAWPSGTVLVGGDGNDTLTGGAGVDTFIPGAGDDTVTGQAADTVSYADQSGPVTVSLAVTTPQSTGSAGTDTISGVGGLVGGAGADTLTGTPGPDRIFGGPGNDVINGGGGADQLIGGSGVDTINGAIDPADLPPASAPITTPGPGPSTGVSATCQGAVDTVAKLTKKLKKAKKAHRSATVKKLKKKLKKAKAKRKKAC